MVFADNLPRFFFLSFFFFYSSAAVLLTSPLPPQEGERKKNITMHISLPSDCGAGVGGSAVSADEWRSFDAVVVYLYYLKKIK